MTTRTLTTAPATSPATVDCLPTRVPIDLTALLGRFAIAGVFWLSGQTKVEGFALNLLEGTASLGWPRLADSAVALFREEYRLPLLAPELAATLAALGEHLLPVLLLLGLGTRWAALGLLVMTAVIQFLVYPGAWPTHGVWAAVLLYLMTLGPGRLSLDHWLGRWLAYRRRPIEAAVAAQSRRATGATALRP